MPRKVGDVDTKPPAELKHKEGALYVSSCAEQGPVTRHGMAKARGSFHYFGATRSSANPNVVEFDEDIITMIPADEAITYAREYGRALATGALKRRKFDEYAAQQAAFARVLKAEEEAEKTELAKASEEKKSEPEGPRAQPPPPSSEQ